MKSFFQKMKKEEGFTLVELMVVVAIIGLLSAVAVPNFKKYQAKAKISEAKLQLSAVYTAEAAFFSDYNIYHNCLTYMGYDPGPESANRYYAVGFNTAATTVLAAHNAAVNSGLNPAATTGCPQNNAVTAGATGGVSNNSSTWFAAGKGIGAAVANAVGFLPATALGNQDVGNMTYIAGAGGVISGDTPFSTAGSNSQLTIDQSKVLRSVINGY